MAGERVGLLPDLVSVDQGQADEMPAARVDIGGRDEDAVAPGDR